MSLLERVIVAHRCRSTHHYIAMDALSQIEGPDAEKWRNLILVHNEELLKGAKAPDAKFKDFKNHVLHIGEGEWGGARDKAMEWYGEAVDALRAKKWSKAIYALGVMSHYYADPIQPFHTGQTEEEGSIHRALEWSVAKSRDVIKERIEEKGYPKVAAGDGPGFVSDMVRAGAEQSHPHYQTLLDHYDIHAGAKNPPAGLDQTLIDIFAELIAYATAGVAVLYSRAFKEAGVKAPMAHITVPGYLATLDIPIRWVSKKIDDVNDRNTVEAMYKELQKTGKVIKTLPDDDKAIRKLHARQVLRTSLKELDAQELRKTGTKHKPRVGFEGVVKAAPEKDLAEEKPAKPSRADKKAEVKAKAEAKRAEKTAAKAAKVEALAAKKAEKEAAIAAEQAAIEAEKEQKKADKQAAQDTKKAGQEAAKAAKQAEKGAAEAARLAEREAAEAAKKAEMEAAVKAKDEEEARKRLAESQEAKKRAAEEADRAAQEEIQREEEERLRAEEEARLEAEEDERIAEEDARMVAAEAARRKLVEEEAARMAADEAEHRAAMEADRLASEAGDDEEDFPVDEAYYEDDEDEGEAEFSLEELAAFETNLTDNGDVVEEDEEDTAIDADEAAPAIAASADEQEAPPVSSFFENETPADVRPRTGLSIDAPVVDAPSIGKKTAKRLAKLGIETVGDLLECDIEEVAFELDVRHIDEQTLIDWQDQAMLMIDVPGLRVHDAQILVGSGIRSAEDLSSASAEKVFRTAMGFLSTPDGARVVRDDHVLKQDEVDDWIGMAREAKSA